MRVIMFTHEGDVATVLPSKKRPRVFPTAVDDELDLRRYQYITTRFVSKKIIQRGIDKTV